MDPTELNTEHAGKKIWLVKVPHYLAQRWRGICDEAKTSAPEQPGPVLGRIRFTANATDSSSTSRQLILANEATADLPQDYQMRVVDTGPAMVAMSDKGGRHAAEGTVVYRFSAEPGAGGSGGLARAADPTYRKLSRERSQAAATKTRTIQLMTDNKFVNIRKPVGAEAVGTKRKAEDKRTALPAEELQPELFRLFERQPRWAFVQLQRHTDQPTQHLKTVLGEIAVQNKVGPYKDMWELKREFKTGGGSEGGAGAV